MLRLGILSPKEAVAVMRRLAGRLRGRLQDESGQVLVWGLLFLVAVGIPLVVLAVGASELGVVRAEAQTAADAAALDAARMAHPQGALDVTYATSTCRLSYPGDGQSPVQACSWSPQQTTQVSGGMASMYGGSGYAGMPEWASMAGCNAMAGRVLSMPWAGRVCIAAKAAPGTTTTWQYPDQGGLPYSYDAAAMAQQYVPPNLPAGTKWAIVAFSTTQGSGKARVVLRVQAPANTGFSALVNHGQPVWVTVAGAAQPSLHALVVSQ